MIVAAPHGRQSGRGGGLQRLQPERRPLGVEAARQLGAKLYTVGVGPAAAIDVAVDSRPR